MWQGRTGVGARTSLPPAVWPVVFSVLLQSPSDCGETPSFWLEAAVVELVYCGAADCSLQPLLRDGVVV